MVDLEHRQIADLGDAIGARVEARAEDDDLVESGLGLADDEVVHVLLAHQRESHRAAEEQPVRQAGAHERRRGKIGDRMDEGSGVGVGAQALRFRPRHFRRTQQGDAAGSAHRLPDALDH